MTPQHPTQSNVERQLRAWADKGDVWATAILLMVERDRYREVLEEIADGPDRHDAVQSIKKAKRALRQNASSPRSNRGLDGPLQERVSSGEEATQ